MLNTQNNVRYTTTFPREYLDELKELVNEQTIPSVNYGIKVALFDYLSQIKKTKYEMEMQEAAKDRDFLERTYECTDDFSHSDSEVSGEW